MHKNKYRAGYFFPAFLFVFFGFYSCKPVIKSFKVTNTKDVEVKKITGDDSLKVNWSVRGKPVLLIHEKASPDPGNKILEMSLVVEKGGKQANQTIQVEMLSASSTTSISFSTTLRADTLVAEGDKNPGVWGNRFEIQTVSNTSKRPLIVTHAGVTTSLDKDGSASAAFAGKPVQGHWIFKSLLTAAEKADHSLLPEQLQINTFINSKQR